MAIGKGLNAFLAAYYKAKESESKEVYQRIQLAYLMNKLGGGIPKGADAEQAAAEKGYKPQFSGGLREGRSSGPAPIGGFDNAFRRTLGFEGTGAATTDNNGGLVKYGINSLAHPDVDVANLTPDQARNIYKTQYWDAINGDELAKSNPALAHVAFDTAVNAGPDKAREFLSGANGDPYKFLQLRQAHQDSLTASGQDKYGGNIPQVWADRNASLRADLDAHIRPQGVPTTAVAQSALPDIPTTGIATAALSAAPLPPPRPDNLGQALPVEAGVTSPTPTAYAPEAYPQGIPVDYAGYDPYNTEAVYAAKGGLVPDLRQRWVQHFQDGGDVLPDPDPYASDPDPTNYQALYTGAGDMGGMPAQPTRQINNPVSALLDTASDAVTAGVKWLHDKFDVANATLSGVGEHPALRALANHEGAAPAGDIQEAEDAVDPNKHLDAGARRLAGMNAAYQYYLAHGDETKAKAVAGSMLMYSKQVAAEAADMAVRAPNPIAAGKILAQGHNQIPGAPQFQVDDNGNYVIKDPKTGKPMDAGVVSPQKLLAAARGMKDGSVFWRTLQTYTKPDADEKTAAQQKLEAAQGAADQFNKVYVPPGGAIPTSPGAVPAAPTATTAAATPATDDDGDTSDEGRSAGTTAPAGTPAPAPVGIPPKPTAKAPTYGAYIGMSPNLSDTLKTKEQKDAWNTLQRDNPAMADRLQREHERRVLYYGSLATQEAAQEAAKTTPAPPPKEAALNQGTIAKDVEAAADAHSAMLTEQKQPVPAPAVVEQTKFLARNIAKHDPERHSGADGFDAANELMKAPFGMPGDKIPTSKDGKGPDLKEAMNMYAYKLTKDKDGPYAVSKEDGTTIRMSQEGRLRLEKLLRDKAADQWKKQNEATGEKRAVSFGPAYDRANDAAYNLVVRGAKAAQGTAGDVVQGAKDFGTAWMQRTAPEFQGAANAVAAVPGMIPQNLPGIPQLVQQGIQTAPPGRLPQQMITAGAMNRPRVIPVQPAPQSAIPIPGNVPMPNWTLYPNDNP